MNNSAFIFIIQVEPFGCRTGKIFRNRKTEKTIFSQDVILRVSQLENGDNEYDWSEQAQIENLANPPLIYTWGQVFDDAIQTTTSSPEDGFSLECNKCRFEGKKVKCAFCALSAAILQTITAAELDRECEGIVIVLPDSFASRFKDNIVSQLHGFRDSIYFVNTSISLALHAVSLIDRESDLEQIGVIRSDISNFSSSVFQLENLEALTENSTSLVIKELDNPGSKLILRYLFEVEGPKPWVTSGQKEIKGFLNLTEASGISTEKNAVELLNLHLLLANLHTFSNDNAIDGIHIYDEKYHRYEYVGIDKSKYYPRLTISDFFDSDDLSTVVCDGFASRCLMDDKALAKFNIITAEAIEGAFIYSQRILENEVVYLENIPEFSIWLDEQNKFSSIMSAVLLDGRSDNKTTETPGIYLEPPEEGWDSSDGEGKHHIDLRIRVALEQGQKPKRITYKKTNITFQQHMLVNQKQELRIETKVVPAVGAVQFTLRLNEK